MKLKTQVLTAAFEVVSKVPSTVLETSRLVRFVFKPTSAHLTLSSGDTLAKAEASLMKKESKLPEPLFVDRRMLAAFLSGAGEEISLTVKSGGCVFRSGAGRLSLQAASQIQAAQYEEWSGNGKRIPLDPETARLLQAFARVAGVGVNERLKAVVVDKKGVLASNELSALLLRTATFFDGRNNPQVRIPTDIAAFARASAKLVCESTGAGVVFQSGNVYQTLTQGAKEDFPVEHLWKMHTAIAKSPTLFKFKSPDLQACVRYIKRFLKSAQSGADLQVAASTGGLTVTLPLAGGQVETKLTATVSAQGKSVETTWRFRDLEFLLSLFTGEVEISFSRQEHYHAFVARVDKSEYVLISSVGSAQD